MMIECNAEQLAEVLTSTKRPTAFFFHTPFCGTCKLAERMLTIALEALPGAVVYTCNLNFTPDRAVAWQIESVPCLVIADGKIPIKKVYAFRSVDHVYAVLRDALTDNQQ